MFLRVGDQGRRRIQPFEKAVSSLRSHICASRLARSAKMRECFHKKIPAFGAPEPAASPQDIDYQLD